MYITINQFVFAIDGNTAKKIFTNPGIYEVEEIRNPFGFGPAWFVLKDTRIGMTSEGWKKEGIEIRREKLLEFVIR